ncbi:MAG: hypothetical protein AB8G15_18695 [Saprospiraceae bacterium]
MKLIKNIIIPFLLLGTFTYTACTTDQTPEEKNRTATLIQGHWELKTAFRNDKETETLSGIYFDFKNGDKMFTNFNMSGEEKETTFELKDKRILAGIGNGYKIESITAENLVLTTKMRGYKFKLDLEKK